MMKKLVYVVMLLAVVAAQGQGRGRSWKRGPLRLEDFGVRTAMSGDTASHLDYAITYTAAGVTEGMHTYLYCRTAAVMYPTASWLAENHADDAELAYNQVLFDMVEVYRRQMQRDAALLSKKVQYDRLLANTMASLDRGMQLIRIATDAGRDSLTLERIRVANREWLNDNPGLRPTFEPNRFWWGAAVDVGVAVPTGSLGHHYGVSIGVEGMRFATGLGRHGLYYFFSAGEAKALDSIENTYGAAQRADVGFGYGFTVIDRPAFSLTPYVSIGMTDYMWWVGDSYTLGLIGNYHFHHWHRISNGVKGKAKCFTVSATGRLFASYARLGDDRNGVTLGLQLGLGILSRSERVTW